MFSETGMNHSSNLESPAPLREQTNGHKALDTMVGSERRSVRSLLALPFYWLGWVTVLMFLFLLWSAEHVEGADSDSDGLTPYRPHSPSWIRRSLD